MKRQVAFTFTVLAALFASAAAASAPPRRIVTLDRDAIVGGRLVPAGAYTLELRSGPAIAEFVQGQRAVAEVPYSLEPVRAVHEKNALHYRSGVGAHDQLIKIVFPKSRLAVEFPVGAPTATPDATEARTASAATRR